MPAPDLDDALARARGGDRAAFGVLYRALAGPLHGYVLANVRRREDAEDVVAQTFLEALRDLAKFTGDPSGFRSWLFRIATHRTIDLARRRVRRAEGSLEQAEAIPDPQVPENEALAREESGRLWAAVGQLPEEQRRVITLRLAGGLTSTEIAEVVGKQRGAVKALQHRALTNLAKALGVPREPGAALSE